MTAPEALGEFYRQVVLTHNRAPCHAGLLEHPTHRARGENPLCGDRLELHLEVHEGRIVNVGHVADGSALLRAMASVMCAALSGKTLPEAEALARAVLAAFDGEPPAPVLPREVTALLPVRHYPNRVKATTMPWSTLRVAIGSGARPRDERETAPVSV